MAPVLPKSEYQCKHQMQLFISPWASVYSSFLAPVLPKSEYQCKHQIQLFISPFLEQLCLENMETLVHRKISRAFSLVSCRYKELGHAFINCELWHVKLHAGSPTVPLFRVFLVRGNSVRPTIPNSCISLTPFRLRHGYDIDNLQCFPL